jgi:hypothetical protein
MVGQVKIVGILMIVHGLTVMIMGGILAALGIMMAGAAPPGGGGPGGPPDPVIFVIIYIAWGGVIAACGLLNSVAGFRVMTFHNRILGLIALFSNILALLSCYCALTAIGMMIYGLIVLFQPDVARAFELVAGGATPEEAIGRLTRRYGDARDDYDEMNRPRRDSDDERYRRRDHWDDRADDEYDRDDDTRS